MVLLTRQGGLGGAGALVPAFRGHFTVFLKGLMS